MSSYYDDLGDAIAYFQQESRQAFAGICAAHGLHEDTSPQDTDENRFRIVFSNAKVRIVVEGIHWGKDASVTLGPNVGDDAASYDVGRLARERPPPSPIAFAGTQIEQIHAYARYLEQHATDLLTGDARLFGALLRQDEQARRVRERQGEEEKQAKLATGYVEVVTPFGSTILQKPRAHLPSYTGVKRDFPTLRELVLVDLLEAIAPGGAWKLGPTVISAWRRDVGAHVQAGDALCDLGTEKAEIEVPSPLSGRLLWVAAEGEPLEASAVVALFLPDSISGPSLSERR